MHQLFFAEDFDESQSRIILTTEESRHIYKVLRKKVGDVIYITDGKGNRIKTTIQTIEKQRVICEIKKISRVDPPQPPIFLAMGLIKHNYFEWAVEKLTEIGITGILPLKSQNVVHTQFKKERLHHILKTALKQSLQFYLPRLWEPMSLKDMIEWADSHSISQRILFEKDAPRAVAEATLTKEPTILVIGPEGGFSENEIQWLKKNYFSTYSLTSTRLRAETAAIVGCAEIALRLRNHIGH